MHTLETKITKTDNGYKATTDYLMGEVPPSEHEAAGERVLRITTMKKIFQKGVIESSASVFTVRDTGRGYKKETHAFGMGTGCGDFSATIKKTPCPRVTEKHIKDCHGEALTYFARILELANNHYAKQAGA